MATTTLTPVYTNVATEYQAITEAAGLHDSSYTGRLKATGDDALDLLNRLSTNGIINLAPGQGAPTILTTDRGRILDLLGVINTGDYTLLITSPGCQQTVIDWLDKYTIMEELEVEDISPDTAHFTIGGPNGKEALASAITLPEEANLIGEMEPYAALPATVGGHGVLVINRPLGNLPSFDLLIDAANAADIWEALEESGITPVGLEAFNAALVQSGIPRHGRELGDDYNPLEAGLIGSVDFAKGCYIGQEVIARLDTYQKVQRYLVRLRFSTDAEVSEGAGLQQEGRNVGKVTSLATIPSTGQLVGLGYVRTAGANPGQTLSLAAPASGAAEVTDLPQLFGPGE